MEPGRGEVGGGMQGPCIAMVAGTALGQDPEPDAVTMTYINNSHTLSISMYRARGGPIAMKRRETPALPVLLNKRVLKFIFKTILKKTQCGSTCEPFKSPWARRPDRFVSAFLFPSHTLIFYFHDNQFPCEHQLVISTSLFLGSTGAIFNRRAREDKHREKLCGRADNFRGQVAIMINLILSIVIETYMVINNMIAIYLRYAVWLRLESTWILLTTEQNSTENN